MRRDIKNLEHNGTLKRSTQVQLISISNIVHINFVIVNVFDFGVTFSGRHVNASTNCNGHLTRQGEA